MAEAAKLAAFWAAVPEWRRWRRFLLGAGLGVFMALGHEQVPAGYLFVFVGLALAFRAALHLSTRQAAWFGWALGVGYFTFTLRWIVDPFFVDPFRHGWMAPFAIMGMGGGLALFWAGAFGLAARFGRAAGPRFALLAVLLIAAEYARAHVWTGFPWALLSYASVDGPPSILLAWVGPHGASLFWAGLAAAMAYGLYRGPKVIWAGLVVIWAALMGAAAVQPAIPAPHAETVRLVQPNAPQHQKWDLEWMPIFFQRAIELTSQPGVPDVVIWPETSVPVLLNNADPWLQAIATAGRGAPVVVGIQRWDGDTGYHNSLAVLEADATVTDIYDKRHLVPFGEYVPLAWIFGKIGLTGVADMAQGFSPGQTGGTLDIPGLGRARVLICYEGIFPEEIIQEGARPEVLVVITNDAWFGNGPGPRQHLAQARARAIELGLPVIRAANTGISAVIDARGMITDALLLNEAGFLDARVPAALPPTLYARTGDWPTLLLLAIVTLMGLFVARRLDIDAAKDED